MNNATIKQEIMTMQQSEIENRIRALRTEAGAAGDTAQVDLCNRALEGDAGALEVCLEMIRETDVE